MAEKSAIDWIALILVIVGALNWGLVGLFDWNLVESILGLRADSMMTVIVYDLVGLAGLWTIYLASKK